MLGRLHRESADASETIPDGLLVLRRRRYSAAAPPRMGGSWAGSTVRVSLCWLFLHLVERRTMARPDADKTGRAAVERVSLVSRHDGSGSSIVLVGWTLCVR